MQDFCNGSFPTDSAGFACWFVKSAQFSPNGLYVITTSSQDRTVRFWAAESGRQIAVLASQDKAAHVKPAPTSAAFNSDGTRVAIVSGDETASIIRVFPTPQDLIDYAHKIMPHELTPCERQRFFLPVVEGDIGKCFGQLEMVIHHRS